jgi:hypothetical protein
MYLAEDLAATSAYGTSESFEKFSRHLDRGWIEEALLSTGTATVRRRRLPAEQVVWLVIGMALLRDLPIADVVRQLELALPNGRDGTVARSAIPPARSRVGAAPLEWLFVRTAEEWAHRSADGDRWRGLALYGADGTTLRIADSDENRRHFGAQSAGTAGRGEAGYPSVRLVALMALRSHLIAAASFGPYDTDERNYAADLWSSVPDRSLLLLDRNYLQANVMVPLRDDDRERHWLMRAKKNTAMRELRRLGKGDAIVEMTVTDYARRQNPSLPRTMEVRAVEYQRPGHEKQLLLTSLLDGDKYPAAEIATLYHERWEIELGYDELKTEMLEREETIRSKSPAMVAQELWGILVAYNLVRLEMERIADDIDVSPSRISFVEALRFIREQWQWAAITGTPGAIPKRLQSMRDKIRRYLLPERRSERSYARAVKIKMSNYARNRRQPLK